MFDQCCEPLKIQQLSFFIIFKSRKKKCNWRYKSPEAEGRCSPLLNMQHSAGIVKNHWTKNESLPSSQPTNRHLRTPLPLLVVQTYQGRGRDREEGAAEQWGRSK